MMWNTQTIAQIKRNKSHAAIRHCLPPQNPVDMEILIQNAQSGHEVDTEKLEKHLRIILQRLREHQLYAKLASVHFG